MLHTCCFNGSPVQNFTICHHLASGKKAEAAQPLKLGQPLVTNKVLCDTWHIIVNFEGQRPFCAHVNPWYCINLKSPGCSVTAPKLSPPLGTLRKLIWLWIMYTAGGEKKKIKKKICVKHRLQWWCKLVVDFPSLNDWAEQRGWGVINPWLVVTTQAKMRRSGGWARTLLLWLVLGCGTNFQRPRHFFPPQLHLIGRSQRGNVAPFCREPVRRTGS